MALHRDIYWVGRQWAVTAVGVQAVDQRLKGAFDIEVARIWEEGLSERMRTHAWLNAEDFERALSVARSRFPAPPRKALPLVESILELIQPGNAEPQKPVETVREAALRARESAPAEPARKLNPPPPLLAMRIERASARFLRQWKIRA